MKRLFLALSFAPLLFALTVAAACSSSSKQTAKPVSTYDENVDDSSGDGGNGNYSSTTHPDAAGLTGIDGAAIDPLRRISSPAEALQILITAYDLQTKDGELGKEQGNTPPMKAFAGDVEQEGKDGKARIRQVAANARITPKNSMLNDQMKFESTSSMQHLNNIFRNMFNSSWCDRVSESASSLIRTIDQDIAPLVEDDDALKQAVATTRAQAEKRHDRALAVKGGLGDPGNADGMFPEPEDPEPQPTTPDPNAAAADGGAAQ